MQAVKKLIKQREAYNRKSVCISKIEEMRKNIDHYQHGEINSDIIQETWDYYVDLTGGNVNTGTVISAIEATFNKLISFK